VVAFSRLTSSALLIALAARPALADRGASAAAAAGAAAAAAPELEPEPEDQVTNSRAGAPGGKKKS